MSEFINYKTFFRNLIIAGVLGLLIPYLVLTYAIPSNAVFDYPLIMTNGFIWLAGYGALGLFAKNTFYRFLIGMGYVALMAYFYTIGSNFFTIFIPHAGFGYMYASGTIFGIPIAVGYNYAWVAVVLLILTGLNVLRKFIKPVDETPERVEKKN
jgi:hypothetical protein